MSAASLPVELSNRILKTSRYLERRDALHDSRLWRSVRWYTGNKDITQVPDTWATNLWLLQLVRSLCDPSVRSIHLLTSVAG